MESSIGDYFQRRQAWRSGLALRLRLLTQWCQSHALLTTENASHIADIQKRLQSDSMVIGFVGEMGRGKSELINALFFGAYKNRVLPVGPGHVTRCPIEIAHAHGGNACLQLLPVETGAGAIHLNEWDDPALAWTVRELQTDDMQHISQAVKAIAQTRVVTKDDGTTTQAPSWRCARLSLPLPALDQGLRIVDMPGLNAPGGGDEATLELLPSCDVIVVVLAADTGLTGSELALWKNHIAQHAASRREILIALNKADARWDAFDEERSLSQQLQQQRLDVAALFGLAPAQIFTLSAQRACNAKRDGDEALLERSGLPTLEKALSHLNLAGRQALWQRHLEYAFASIKSDLEHALAARAQDIARRKEEAEHLAQRPPHPAATAAKNSEKTGIPHAKIKAIQSILHKQMKKVRSVLQQPVLKISIRQLELALASSPDIGSVHQAYANLQKAVRKQWEPAAAQADEMVLMLASALPSVQSDPAHGISVPRPPPISPYEAQLDQAVAGHLQYLGNSRLHQLKQPDFTQKLSKQLHDRIADIYAQMANDFDNWCTQIDAHLERSVAAAHGAVQHQHDQNARDTAQAAQALAQLRAEETDLHDMYAMLDEHFLNLQDANTDY